MRRVLLLCPLLLAACVETGGLSTGGAEGTPRFGASVVDVTARPSQVTFRMADGSRCIGERPEGERSGWSGVTDEACGYALPYSVSFSRGGQARRFTIEDPGGTLTGGGQAGPRAEVFVTDTDGQRRLFVRPLRNAVFEDAPTG
ncbi:hypothetical protein [Jannaschia aquimarina]|uniref:Uncharacterized protein n=1 Tax=Jannaschia aquimarina TaxID=935700 RepID=A0A0D1EEC6_9RHOB|nr:hypothetical protein [Jannaschia aquimarina]KIT16064.1 hypothetical protein jaqu_23360 [Jannaschia aquimarina]SNT01471.1 hypothetical protein SAMN05421775_104247 [Jannaschia aquimarina]